MLENPHFQPAPPVRPMTIHDHVDSAWPLEAVRDERGVWVVGDLADRSTTTN